MRLYTYTGVWTIITRVIDKLSAHARRQQRHEARERERTAAEERTRRENTAARFDEKMLKRRAR